MNEKKITSYRDLRVWQDAMSLAESCYQLTRSFPKDETFGLTTQIRRSASSIAANVAEGQGRENTQAFIQFLRISQGSLKELETHLLLAERVGLGTKPEFVQLLERCQALGKMLRSLIRAPQLRRARR
ncbi:MAG: four helix bundle protein [Alphaproteobacteria bacterium]